LHFLLAFSIDQVGGGRFVCGCWEDRFPTRLSLCVFWENRFVFGFAVKKKVVPYSNS
jgi:hypothetical protein